MLLVVRFRVLKGHFSADRHLAFEGAAWYWHFIDVVRLGLYVMVYWMKVAQGLRRAQLFMLNQGTSP